MHIAGDQHQVAARRPMISRQNDPLGRARCQYSLAFGTLQLSDADLPCHWTNFDFPSSEPGGWVGSGCA